MSPTNYPTTLDTITQLPNNRDDATNEATNHPADHNNLSDAVRAIEGELGTLPKGAAASVKARLEAVENVYQVELASTFTLVSPHRVILLSGQFVAKRETVLLTVDIVACSPGISHATLELWYVENGVASLPGPGTIEADWNTPHAAVEHVNLGSIPGVPGVKFWNEVQPGYGYPRAPVPYSSRRELSGLTVGETYDWEVTAAVVGNANPIYDVGDGPGDMDISLHEDVDAYLHAVVRNDLSDPNTATVIRIGHAAQHPHDRVLGSVDLPGAYGGGGGVAMTPAGQRAIVTNQVHGSITVIDTSQNGKAPLKAVADVAVPGTDPQPLGVVIGDDSTGGWVACWNVPQVVPFAVGTGVMGTPIALTAASNPVGIAKPRGVLKLVVPLNATGKVAVIDLNTSAVTETAVLGSSTSHPNAVACSPDGAYAWVTTRTTKKLWKINLTTLALVSSVDLDEAPVSGGVAAMSDGRTVIVVSDKNSTLGHNVFDFDTSVDPPVLYTNYKSGSINEPVLLSDSGQGSVAITNDGAVYFPSPALDRINVFYAGQLLIREPTDSFHNEQARVLIEGATA